LGAASGFRQLPDIHPRYPPVCTSVEKKVKTKEKAIRERELQKIK
jgi:hypothetical protein